MELEEVRKRNIFPTDADLEVADCTKETQNWEKQSSSTSAAPGLRTTTSPADVASAWAGPDKTKHPRDVHSGKKGGLNTGREGAQLASSGAWRCGSDYQDADSGNCNLDRLERGPKFWLGGSECGELTVKTSSSPSSPSFWSAVEEVVEPVVRETAINPSSADL